jgi:hypothetical protein
MDEVFGSNLGDIIVVAEGTTLPTCVPRLPSDGNILISPLPPLKQHFDWAKDKLFQAAGTEGLQVDCQRISI